MKDFEDYIRIGTDHFGLTGADLQKWVANIMKEDREREEKDREREERAEERATRVAEAERDARAAEADRAARIAETARLEAEAARAHELELLRVKKELADQSAAESQDSHPGGNNRTPRGPAYRFTAYNDKSDDLDTWFTLFETQCKAFGVPDKDMRGHLLGLFSGKFRDTLLTLVDEPDYAHVRDKMLRTYNLTTNGYREKFFKLSPNQGESIAAFVQRLRACFDKWVSLANIEKTYEALRDLILAHQIFQTCNAEFIKFLVERDINKTEDIVEDANRFFEARPGVPIAKTNDKYLAGNAAFGRGKPNLTSQSYAGYKNNHHNSNRADYGGSFRGVDHRGGNRGRYGFGGPMGRGEALNNRGGASGSSYSRGRGFQPSYPRGNKFGDGRHRCYNCGDSSHYSPDCPKKSGGKMLVRCQYCKKMGHEADYCSSLKKSTGVPGKASMIEGDFNALKIPINTDFSVHDTPWKQQHIYSGFLLDKEVSKPITILRDTGSAVHAIHERFVSPEQYLGKSQSLVTFGGREESFDLAEISIDTPFLTGVVTACVLKNYPEKFRYFDLLVGNGGVLGSPVAQDPSSEVVDFWYKSHSPISEDEFSLPCSQVTTRAASRKKSVDSILTSSCLDFNLTHAELASMQSEDESLKKYFDLVGQPPKLYNSAKSSSKCSFELRNCVLVRIFSSNDEDLVQIMVPLQLRAKLLSLSHDKPFSAHMGVRRTLYRLTLSFYWPGISRDVTKFCKSCEICLKARPKGKTPKAPLQISPVFEKPFYKCAIDLIGPLPLTEKKNRFVLTLIDYTTRWVEAAPLRETTTTAVSEELITFFSRFGLPSIVLSDGGP